MIRIVKPEVPVEWLREYEHLETRTEFLGADDERILGWCTVEDLADASNAGLSTVHEMSLRPCQVIAEPGGPTQVECGRWALAFKEDVGQLTAGRGRDLLAIGWRTLLRGSVVTRTLNKFRGPLPDPKPVKVARGCLFSSCGFLAYVPPSPSPCPNPRPPPHDFV